MMKNHLTPQQFRAVFMWAYTFRELAFNDDPAFAAWLDGKLSGLRVAVECLGCGEATADLRRATWDSMSKPSSARAFLRAHGWTIDEQSQEQEAA